MADNMVVRRGIKLYIDGVEVEASVSSIRKQIKILTNEQAKMVLDSDDYDKAGQKIRELEQLNQKHKKSLKGITDEATTAGNSLTKWQAGIAGFMGGIASKVADYAMGLVYGIKGKIDEAIQSFNDYEEKVDNLGSLTGLAGQDLKWLGDQAKQMSASVVEGSINIKTGADAIVDGFTKMGSKRPDLLKNKEDLKSVTQEAIILAEAAKSDLEPAVDSLAMVMNQFNAPASDARRIINALAAGSKEGAGEIPYLTKAIEKSGTVAADVGMSYESLIGTIETLAPRIAQPEEAGTALKGVILNLQKTADDTNPSIVGFSKAIENLGSKHLAAKELLKIFGKETITEAMILMNNQAETKRYTEAVTGTNVAIEQATTNTNNNNAMLAHSKNELANVRLELGERFAPAQISANNGLVSMSKALLSIINFTYDYKNVIVPATLGIVTYTVAIKAAAMWEKLRTIELSKNIIVSNIQAAAIRLQILLNGEATMAQKRALVATRALNAAVLTNPWILAAAAIVAIGTALYMYTNRVTAAMEAQKALNDVNSDAKKSILEQKNAVEDLLKTARDHTKSSKERYDAVEQLRKISPEYLGDLRLEKIGTLEATSAVEKYVASIEKLARIEAAKQKLVELQKAMIDLETSGKGAEVSFGQKLWNGVKALGNSSQVAIQNAKSYASNISNETNKIKAQIDMMDDIIGGKKSLQVYEPDKKKQSDPTSGAAEKAKKATEEYNRLNAQITELENKQEIQIANKSKLADQATSELITLRQRRQEEQDIIRINEELIKSKGVAAKKSTDYSKMSSEELQRLADDGDELAKKELPKVKKKEAAAKAHHEYMIKIEALYNEAVSEMLIASQDREIAIEQAAAAKKLNSIKGHTQEEEDTRQAIKDASERKISDINAKYEKERNDKGLQIKANYFSEILKGARVNSAEYVAISLAQAETEREIELSQKNITGKKKYEIEEAYAQKVRALRLTKMGQSLTDISNSLYNEESRYQAQAIIDDANQKYNYENRKKQLEVQHQQELADSINTGKSQQLIEAENYAKKRKLAEDYYSFLAGKIQEYAGYAASAFGSIDQIMQNNEKRQLDAATKDNTKKKADLKKQLDAKLISQKDYDAKVAAADEDLDKKKRKVDHDQAVRAKITSAFEAGINIAVAITKAMSSLQLWLIPVISALGAIQLAAILTSPVPAYKDGGFTDGDKIYRAGEKGKEYIAPAEQVNDPITGPIIRQLNDARLGKISKYEIAQPVMPAFASMQEAAKSANTVHTIIVNGNTGSSADDSKLSDLHETVKELVAEYKQLNTYLSDPKNRQASINRDLLTKFDKEEKDLKDLANFK